MTLRQLRLRAVWLLVLPFLWLSRPTPLLVGAGFALALAGLALRGWAAGTIHKERELTTSGPYAFLRHPLYAGSLLLGSGVTLAGGHWIWPLLFLAFFAGVYGRTMAGEAALLADLFGPRFEEYRRNVPALLPRPTPWRATTGEADVPGQAGFTWARYRRNKEWEAALGTAAAFAFLAVKATV